MTGEDKEQTTQEETHQNLKKQDVTVGQDSNEQHSIQEKDSGEETSKQDDGRTSMASESSSHTQNTDSGKTRYFLGGRLKMSKADHGFQKRDLAEDADRKSNSSLHLCLFNGCFATCWEDSKADRRLQQCYDLYGKHGVQRVSEINCLLIPHQCLFWLIVRCGREPDC